MRVCLLLPCGQSPVVDMQHDHVLKKVELTSWLSFVMSNCEFVTFPLVSWVRCGT